jgi:hypothetical protein
MTYGVGNPGPGLGQAQNVTGLNWFVEFQPSPFDNYVKKFVSDLWQVGGFLHL